MRDIDKKIKQWADKFKPGEGNSQRTPEQIVSFLNSRKRIEKRNFIFTGQLYPFRKVFAAFSIFIILSIIVFQLKNSGKQQLFFLQKKELTEIKKVCNELESLFPEGMQWSRMDNGRMEMQAGEYRQIALTSNPGKVLLSFDMISKRNGKVFSRKRNYFVIWGEEPVELKDKEMSTLWIQKVDDDKLYISLNLTMANDPCQFHLQNDYLQSIGSSQLIASKISGEEVCDFYQTAYLL